MSTSRSTYSSNRDPLRGPPEVFHDGFRMSEWVGFLDGAGFENIVVDTHLYVTWHTLEAPESELAEYLAHVARRFGDTLRVYSAYFPILVGEWNVDRRLRRRPVWRARYDGTTHGAWPPLTWPPSRRLSAGATRRSATTGCRVLDLEFARRRFGQPKPAGHAAAGQSDPQGATYQLMTGSRSSERSRGFRLLIEPTSVSSYKRRIPHDGSWGRCPPPGP